MHILYASTYSHVCREFAGTCVQIGTMHTTHIHPILSLFQPALSKNPQHFTSPWRWPIRNGCGWRARRSCSMTPIPTWWVIGASNRAMWSWSGSATLVMAGMRTTRPVRTASSDRSSDRRWTEFSSLFGGSFAEWGPWPFRWLSQQSLGWCRGPCPWPRGVEPRGWIFQWKKWEVLLWCPTLSWDGRWTGVKVR